MIGVIFQGATIHNWHNGCQKFWLIQVANLLCPAQMLILLEEQTELWLISRTRKEKGRECVIPHPYLLKLWPHGCSMSVACGELALYSEFNFLARRLPRCIARPDRTRAWHSLKLSFTKPDEEASHDRTHSGQV